MANQHRYFRSVKLFLYNFAKALSFASLLTPLSVRSCSPCRRTESLLEPWSGNSGLLRPTITEG